MPKVLVLKAPKTSCTEMIVFAFFCRILAEKNRIRSRRPVTVACNGEVPRLSQTFPEVSPFLWEAWHPLLTHQKTFSEPLKKLARLFGIFEFMTDAAFLLTVGSFLLTLELFHLQLTILAFLLRVGPLLVSWSFLAYNFSFVFTVGAFFACSWKVRLIRALRDCKQRSLTVSKKSSNSKWKSSPRLFLPHEWESAKVSHKRVFAL